MGVSQGWGGPEAGCAWAHQQPRDRGPPGDAGSWPAVGSGSAGPTLRLTPGLTLFPFPGGRWPRTPDSRFLLIKAALITSVNRVEGFGSQKAPRLCLVSREAGRPSGSEHGFDVRSRKECCHLSKRTGPCVHPQCWDGVSTPRSSAPVPRQPGGKSPVSLWF